MDSNTRYFIEILEKIGSPLMQAVTASGAEDVDQAQAMAALLSRTVQASINMGSGFKFADMPDQGDSVRVALAALAGPLVAEQYAQNKVMPAEADLAKIVGVLGSVLTFAENFKPSEENAQRLADLNATGKAVDAPQAELQYIQAFVPVVQAVSGFSFGQSDKKLALDIADRLVKRGVEFREMQFPALKDADAQKRAELVIVQAMAQLYAECHQSVVAQLSTMGDASGAVPGLDEVWAAFDLRASMLEIMMQGLLPGSDQKGADQKSPVQASASPAPVIEEAPPVPDGAPPVFKTPPPIDADAVIKAPEEAPAIFGAKAPEDDDSPALPSVDAVIEDSSVQAAMPQAPETPAAAGNPMAMFATPKKKEEASETPAPAPVSPEEVAVDDDPPASEAPVSEETGDEEKSGDSSNPMSFFKTGG